MKVLKKILIVIAIIIAIPLIIALFVKKEYSVEREVVINRPKQEVYDYIKYLKNQDNYSKWATMDPDMHKEYRGTDGTVGFVSAWDGDEVGAGEQEITKMENGSRIDSEIRFIKPIKSVATVYLTTESAGEPQTRVKWGFEGKMPYPLNILRLFMDMPEMVGKDLQTGLDKLKTILEK